MNDRVTATSSPDGGGLVAPVQPLLRRDDVHAPETPVVAVGGVGVLLHLEGVVLDVVYGRQDDAGMILLHAGQDGHGPGGDGKTREPDVKSWTFRNQIFRGCIPQGSEETKRKKKELW